MPEPTEPTALEVRDRNRFVVKRTTSGLVTIATAAAALLMHVHGALIALAMSGASHMTTDLFAAWWSWRDLRANRRLGEAD